MAHLDPKVVANDESLEVKDHPLEEFSRSRGLELDGDLSITRHKNTQARDKQAIAQQHSSIKAYYHTITGRGAQAARHHS